MVSWFPWYHVTLELKTNRTGQFTSKGYVAMWIAITFFEAQEVRKHSQVIGHLNASQI